MPNGMKPPRERSRGLIALLHVTRHTSLQSPTPFVILNITQQISQMAQNLDKTTPDDVWKNLLSAEEYRILRKKGTEAAGTGEYNKHYEPGTYVCGGCGSPLYKSDTKFDSGCGWPAFYAEIEGAVDRHVDISHGMKRVEITCSKCGGHLGHVFEGEKFPTPTDQRHCVNSKALKFKPGQPMSSN